VPCMRLRHSIHRTHARVAHAWWGVPCMRLRHSIHRTHARVAHTWRGVPCMRLRHSIHRQNRAVLHIVKPPTRPRPVSGLLHQAALDRIVMHIVELLLNLLLAPDVEVVKPPLPHSMASMVMNSRRELQPVQILSHQANSRLWRRFFRMNLALRSSSFCMISEGLASSDGQSRMWKCSGIKTKPMIRKSNSSRKSRQASE